MRSNKYKAQPQIVDGVKFASKKEAKRYGELLWLEKAGQIKDLICHPRFEMIVNSQKIGRYTADFQYRDVKTEKIVVEDVKGGRATQTEAFRLRWKLCKVLFPDFLFKVV